MKIRANKLTNKTKSTAIAGTSVAALFTVLQWILPQYGVKVPDKVLESLLALGVASVPVAAAFLTKEKAESFNPEDLREYIACLDEKEREALLEPVEGDQIVG